MAYKVGTTIVIDNSGNVDWNRLANKPAFIPIGQNLTLQTGRVISTSGSGTTQTDTVVGMEYTSSTTYRPLVTRVLTTANCTSNCNCNCRC
jgi:hypothetical protein